MNNVNHVVALNDAATFLLAAIALRRSSPATICAALELLRTTNPEIVAWVLTELPHIMERESVQWAQQP